MSTTLSPQPKGLGRLKEFDERSRSFPIRNLVAPKPPRSYTWGLDEAPLDQGAEGACVGFAFTHDLIARPKIVRGLNATFARETVYWGTQLHDPWPGGAYPGADPWYDGTSVLSAAKFMMSKGYYTSYHWAFTLDEMILGVGYGGPVVIGVDWLEGMEDPDANGVLHVTGEISGGHCILVNGVNVRTKHFQLINSWGPSWGMNGRCFVSFDDMKKLLAAQGEVCLLTRK